jgi:hypothetical protein
MEKFSQVEVPLPPSFVVNFVVNLSLSKADFQKNPFCPPMFRYPSNS